jgi:uncharacterized protein (UPF0332 family)
MSVNEQQEKKKEYYSEAIRYMDNAKQCLKKAHKDGDFYHDRKYVKMACGTAYSGLLVALDCFLIMKGVQKPTSAKQRKSIEHYQSNLANIDRKMLDQLNGAYEILHLWGYYDGITTVSVVRKGLDIASKLIEKIKPTETIDDTFKQTGSFETVSGIICHQCNTNNDDTSNFCKNCGTELKIKN